MINTMKNQYPVSSLRNLEFALLLLFCYCGLTTSVQIDSKTIVKDSETTAQQQRSILVNDDELSTIEIVPRKAGTCLKEPASTEEELRTIQEIKKEAKSVNGGGGGLFQTPLNRIIGGTDVVTPAKYPFFVSWSGECGGSLIYEDLVLTAAHCMPIVSNTVIVNAYELFSRDTTGATVRNIALRIQHPDYNPITIDNDFMILKLEAPVPDVTPLTLNESSQTPAVKDPLTVIGLGVTTVQNRELADTLQQVEVDTMSNQYCNSRYEQILNTNVVFCAGKTSGGKDSCQGDSGGPIFTTNEEGDAVSQVGVVSWGIGCAQAGYPGIYARVSSAKQWIDEQICQLADNPPSSICDNLFPPPSENEEKVTIKIRTDLYPVETSWTLKDKATNVEIGYVRKGSYTLPNKVYTRIFNLEKNKEYTFQIQDENRDGMCCSFGEGSYEVSTKEGSTILASGGTFEGASESKTFVVSDTGELIPTLSPTPAPNNDLDGSASLELSIYTDGFPLETSWSLLDETSNRNVASRPSKSYTIKNQLYTSSINGVYPGRTYKFTISDSSGDGICCEYGRGRYLMKHGDRLLFSGNGSFGTEDSTTFTVPQDDTPATSPPTKVPITKEPTKTPTTFQPTKEPTKAPVAPQPTKEPTTAPITQQPTKEPSKAPTTPQPTNTPTEAPTTQQPTNAPITKRPTSQPTEAPITPQPTKEPTEAPITSKPTNQPTEAPVSLEPTDAPIGPRGCSNKVGTVEIDRIFGEQTCEWITENFNRYSHLCEQVDVAIHCPHTCSLCHVFL